jgi:hypothetical protein
MSVKLSTKLRNDLMSGEDLRRIFEDAVIKVYSGAAPASADLAPTGTLLVTVSKSAGTVSAGEKSVAQQAKLLIGSHAPAETFTLIVNGTSYIYTNTPDAGDEIAVAAAFATYINENCNLVEAMASGTATVYIRSKFKGTALTWTIAGTGTINTTTGAQALADTVSNVTADTIRFGAAVDGVLSKAAETWQGTAVATGVAGYFRMVNSTDDASDDSTNKAFPRIQGACGVSGTEMTLSNTTITSGAPQTIDTATITMPAS